MRVRFPIAAACAVAGISVLNSCGGQMVTEVPNRPLSRLFVGFSYVGQFPGGIAAELPLHGLQGLPLPGEIKPGVRYVFHYPAPKGDGPFPLGLLIKRLVALGFEAPEPTSIISLSSGGPLYEIKFRRESCSGSIRHEVDKALLSSPWSWGKRWEPDDTILTASPGCNL